MSSYIPAFSVCNNFMGDNRMTLGASPRQLLSFRFLFFIRTINSPASLMDTQAIGKANKDTVLFLFKSGATGQVVITWRVEEKHTSQFDFPNPFSNAQGILVNMTTLHCEVEKQLSKVARQETKSVFGRDKY